MLGAIAGSIAEGMYGGVPRVVADPVLARLPSDLRAVTERFITRYAVPVA